MTNKTRIFLGFTSSILLLELLVRLLSPVLGPPSTAWNMMEQVKTLKLDALMGAGKTIDFVFMGNSTTWIGVNPNIIDADLHGQVTTFNAAMNGSTSLSIRTYATDYIIPRVHPKYLIVLFSQGGLRTREDNANYTKSSPRSTFLSRYFYLYRYRNTLRDPMTLNTLRRSIEYKSSHEGIVYRWAKDVDANGYSTFPQVSAKMDGQGWNLNRAILTSKPYVVVPKVGLDDMLSIKRLADRDGTKLIIGTVPTIKFDGKYRATIAALAGKVGVPFIQGNDAATSGIYFQDSVHLNAAGAVVFSHYIANQISSFR